MTTRPQCFVCVEDFTHNYYNMWRSKMRTLLRVKLMNMVHLWHFICWFKLQENFSQKVYFVVITLLMAYTSVFVLSANAVICPSTCNVQLIPMFRMKITVFWNIVPCSLVENNWSFRGAYGCHHQGISQFLLNYMAQCSIPEDSHLHTHQHDNLKSHHSIQNVL
jgi:hypothetical protein